MWNYLAIVRQTIDRNHPGILFRKEIGCNTHQKKILWHLGKQNCSCVWLHRYSAPNVCLKGDTLASSCHVAPSGRQRGSKPHCLLPSFSWVAWARQPWPWLGCPVLPQGPSCLPGGYAAACEPHHMPQGHQRRRHFPSPELSSPFTVTAWLPESGAGPTNSSGKTLASVLGLI